MRVLLHSHIHQVEELCQAGTISLESHVECVEKKNGNKKWVNWAQMQRMYLNCIFKIIAYIELFTIQTNYA